MFRDAGENYTLMSIAEVLLNCGVGTGHADAALTAASRGSLPSGDPAKTLVVRLSSHQDNRRPSPHKWHSSMLHGRSPKEAIEEELHKFVFENKMYAERKK
jgi:hypothetical protein